MMSDLRNLKVLAWFLQKFELNFDILSSLRELSKQIKGEFDFRWAKTVSTRRGIPRGPPLSFAGYCEVSQRLLSNQYGHPQRLALSRTDLERAMVSPSRAKRCILSDMTLE